MEITLKEGVFYSHVTAEELSKYFSKSILVPAFKDNKLCYINPSHILYAEDKK